VKGIVAKPHGKTSPASGVSAEAVEKSPRRARLSACVDGNGAEEVSGSQAIILSTAVAVGRRVEGGRLRREKSSYI
jgi:hypothetical protein